VVQKMAAPTKIESIFIFYNNIEKTTCNTHSRKIPLRAWTINKMAKVNDVRIIVEKDQKKILTERKRTAKAVD